MGQLGMKGRGRRKDMRWALDRISKRGRCRGDITKQHTCSCMALGSKALPGKRGGVRSLLSGGNLASLM